MKKNLNRVILLSILLVGCASAPSSKKVAKNIFELGDNKTFQEIETSLKRGNNFLSEGYEVSATLLSKSLIYKKIDERAKKNMDDNTKVLNDKKEADGPLLKNTCFLINVSTYILEQAKFNNWVVKMMVGESLHNVLLKNIEGVDSVPDTYRDFNGRTWHNSSIGCSKKIPEEDLKNQGFSLYLIPQWKTNTADGKSTLIWTFD